MARDPQGRPGTLPAEAVARFVRRCGPGSVVCVSACLVGKPCRFDGRARPHDAVLRLVRAVRGRGGRVQLVCPECAARMERPRPPAEQQPDGRVTNAEGADVTDAFDRGARMTRVLVDRCAPDLVVLKAKSPSCGVHQVYDGTFTGALAPGMGRAARLLREAGHALVDEDDVARGFSAR